MYSPCNIAVANLSSREEVDKFGGDAAYIYLSIYLSIYLHLSIDLYSICYSYISICLFIYV